MAKHQRPPPAAGGSKWPFQSIPIIHAFREALPALLHQVYDGGTLAYDAARGRMLHIMYNTYKNFLNRLRRRRHASRPASVASPAFIETLEPRTFLSATLGVGSNVFDFIDHDGDAISVRLRGPGTAAITLDNDATSGADIDSIVLEGTSRRSSLYVRVGKQRHRVTGINAQPALFADSDLTTTIGLITGEGSLRNLSLKDVAVDGEGVRLAGSLRSMLAGALENGADLILGEGRSALRVEVGRIRGAGDDHVVVSTPGDIRSLSVRQNSSGLRARIGGELRALLARGRRGAPVSVEDWRLDVDEDIRKVFISGDLLSGSILAAGEGVGRYRLGGSMVDSMLLAGARLDGQFDLPGATFDVADIGKASIAGDVLDSVIAAGGDPGDDARFAGGEVLEGGAIGSLKIGGHVIGIRSTHVNPGVYAAKLGRLRVNGINLTGKAIPSAGVTMGSAIIDPLPSAENALTVEDIETILDRAIRRADQLGSAATISVTDREGNILAVVRMKDAPLFVDIDAGGAGGLEAVDGIVRTSLIAATKAGTASFLSTSLGNAFTTRTAGYIIQRHFPPGIDLLDSGPLFGVQLSSLPTSDVNRLPLGLSADPGGLPLYRGNELLGGIGVEVNGTYTVDPSRVGGAPTTEERIALAGQIGFAPPARIRADRIFVDGIRLDYANARPPKLSSLGAAAELETLVSTGEVDILVSPRVSPGSKFESAVLGRILGEVPNNALVDFFDDDTKSFAFIDGDEAAPGVGLTTDDVDTILLQAHELNSRLRSQIRQQRQRSRVTVAVVDQNGNLLGAFRSVDAPVFGFDVSVQKARTAAFFSRVDAGDQLRELDDEFVLFDPPRDLSTVQGITGTDGNAVIDPSVDDPFGRHVDLANAIGVGLDGSVAMADRTGGFLSRPNLPDGIDGARPGPFSAQSPDAFSPFNTGIQTTLILPNLVGFLVTFNSIADEMGEVAALAMFMDGTIGGPSAVPNDDAGGGLPGSSLANGMQIFAGSVPLYTDGVLVGGVGVSGDGIEQDDFVSFAGAAGFQQFGPGVRRADNVKIAGGIRLPYIKLPRSPFAGV